MISSDVYEVRLVPKKLGSKSRCSKWGLNRWTQAYLLLSWVDSDAVSEIQIGPRLGLLCKWTYLAYILVTSVQTQSIENPVLDVIIKWVQGTLGISPFGIWSGSCDPHLWFGCAHSHMKLIVFQWIASRTLGYLHSLHHGPILWWSSSVGGYIWAWGYNAIVLIQT